MAGSRRINWVNTVFITTTPILAVLLTGVYVFYNGVRWTDFAIFLAMYALAGYSITAGYHRYFSHRSYDCHWSLRLAYLLFGAAAIQNSVLKWCRDHRIHHQKVDTEADPYNVKEGFFHAHMGWIFYKTPEERDFRTVPDLMRDPLVRLQHRYYLPIVILVGFGLPSLAGAAVGRPFAGFLWGGLVRTVIVQHLTFLINSAAHFWGKRPYSLDNTARDSWWLAFFTYGEGFHNFHHRFCADYRNGYRWYHFDPTKWWIAAMSWFGLTWRLTRYREEHILKARIETDMRRVQARLANAPRELAARMEKRMAEARAQLEAAHASWDEAKNRCRELKHSMGANSESARRRWANASEQWRLRTRQYGFQFQAAQARWALLIAAFSRFHGHGTML